MDGAGPHCARNSLKELKQPKTILLVILIAVLQCMKKVTLCFIVSLRVVNMYSFTQLTTKPWLAS